MNVRVVQHRVEKPQAKTMYTLKAPLLKYYDSETRSTYSCTSRESVTNFKKYSCNLKEECHERQGT
jgi:hypothetical protein